jgi:hypothetical protein
LLLCSAYVCEYIVQMLKVMQSDFFSLLTIAKIASTKYSIQNVVKRKVVHTAGSSSSPWEASLGLLVSGLSLPEEECSWRVRDS